MNWGPHDAWSRGPLFILHGFTLYVYLINCVCPTCPQEVWSEEEDCIPLLSAEMDYLTSARHSLTQVLERAASLLGVEQDSDEEAGQDSEGSESEEDFDDYYGNDGDDLATPRLGSMSICGSQVFRINDSSFTSIQSQCGGDS